MSESTPRAENPEAQQNAQIGHPSHDWEHWTDHSECMRCGSNTGCDRDAFERCVMADD